MNAQKLYHQLESDFITPEMSDDWIDHMEPIADLISEEFKKRSMGLVCDFTDEVTHVFTAVFPSLPVLQEILDRETENAMLFVHHPMIWDIRLAPDVFQNMDRALLGQLKARHISIYNLHVPLDHYGDYSTSVSLARAIGVEPEEAFAPYRGALCGVIGTTKQKTLRELQKAYREALGFETKLHQYGDQEIKDGRVAIVAGGGLGETIEEVVEKGTNVFVTGISVLNDHSRPDHDIAKASGISILGGTHYGSEMFACQNMVNYFQTLDLPAEFIQDVPVMEDL